MKRSSTFTELLDKSPLASETNEPPKNLFPYQIVGIDFLSSRRAALLADRPGLGKSAQTIRAADKIGAKRLLVVCPAVARFNWLREFGMWGTIPRDFTVVYSASDTIPASKSVITSFDLARRIPRSVLGLFDLIVIDEVHMCKSVHAGRTHAIFGKEGIIHGQTSQPPVWVLSGTPAPNHAGELWPLLYTFGVTRLTFDDFIQRYCVLTETTFGRRGEKGSFKPTGTRKDRIPELRGLLAKIMLRRTEDEVADQLPKISFKSIVVEPGDVDISTAFTSWIFPEDRTKELEQKIKDDMRDAKKAINTGEIEALKTVAKSVATLRRYIGCQKVDEVAKLVSEELKANLYNKIVIFAIHRDVIEGLRTKLEEFNPLTLYGGSKFDRAHRNIDKFNTFPKFRVFIGNIAACGIAINLTGANQVLMIEQEWTPTMNDQAIKRVHRQGQTRPVFVRIVALARSIDEHVARILKRKQEELTLVFDGDKKPSSLDELLK